MCRGPQEKKQEKSACLLRKPEECSPDLLEAADSLSRGKCQRPTVLAHLGRHHKAITSLPTEDAPVRLQGGQEDTCKVLHRVCQFVESKT